MFRQIFLSASLVLASPLFAQTPATQASAPSQSTTKSDAKKSGNEQEAFIIEQSLTSEAYETDGTGIYENTSRVRMQSEAGVQQFGLLTLPYEKNFQTADFEYVRVRKPDGTVVNTSLDNVQDIEAEVTRAAPFYSDLREKHIAVKGLGVGDIVEWRSVMHMFKALAPGHFWSSYEFTKEAIILDEQFRFSVPKDMYVKVKSSAEQPQVRVEAARRIYEWKRSQLKREDVDPKLKFGPPFKVPQPDVEISSFKSWDELGRWYYELQRDRIVPSAEVKAKALELTKNAKTDDEKIRVLYDFVATRFRYIGVAFGIGRYQPHSAADVLDNSYGDCKDKHTLLASLLQAVGIEASPAIISSMRAIDADVPSPAQFDHVITVVHRGNDLLWLDTTSEVAPFGMLLANLRDKKVLLIALDGSASLVKTPDKPGVDAFEKFQMTGALSNSGELKASMQNELRGDTEVIVRSVFHAVPQPKWKDVVQNLSYGLGFAGTVSEVTASAPEQTTEPFHFSYAYDRTDFSDWASNKRITVPMPPITVPHLNDEHEKSGQPLYLGSAGKVDYVSDIKLPDGYTPQLPTNLDLTTDFAEYHSTYSLKDGILHAERRMTVLMKEVPATKFASYRDFEHKVSDDQGAWVLFTSAAVQTPVSSTNKATENALSWPAVPNTDAGREFNDGLTLLQEGNIDAALAKFEEAAQRDPKLPGVWASMGSVHWMKRDLDAALGDLRRQTEETPDVPIAFANLARLLVQMHRRDEAIPVLQKLVALTPKRPDSIEAYGNQLIAANKPSAAIELFENAIKQNPTETGFHFSLGKAYLQSHENVMAVEQYKQAIALASAEQRDAIQNDAAYELAEKNVDLVQAEEWSKAAVDHVERETQDVSLAKLDSKQLYRMRELSMYWDTLGWIRFQKGEYRNAEGYLNAAWWLRQNATIGEHLAKVYEQLHESQKAAQFRQLATVTPDRDGTQPTPEQAARDAKFGWKAADWDPREALGKMRTMHVPVSGRTSNKSESAEFMVLLSNSNDDLKAASNAPRMINASARSLKPSPIADVKVDAVRFINGADDLKAAQKALERTDFALRLPESSSVKLVRRGILMCGPYANGCNFTLLTADSVHSAE
jgi:tetratricopeptide (TPR) repeat protein